MEPEVSTVFKVCCHMLSPQGKGVASALPADLRRETAQTKISVAAGLSTTWRSNKEDDVLVSLQFLFFITNTLKTECGDQSGRGFKHIYMYTQASPLLGVPSKSMEWWDIYVMKWLHIFLGYCPSVKKRSFIWNTQLVTVTYSACSIFV